jgi:putative oxidoreductase
VYIFNTLGAEPWGRIASGIIELIASALLLTPRTVVLGAALAMATMAGAIGSHLAKLGVALPAVGDHGELFALAVIVFVCSAGVLYLHRDELRIISAAARL